MNTQQIVIASFGIFVFAVVTVATLLFGYLRFEAAAVAADLDPARDSWEDGHDSDDAAQITVPSSLPVSATPAM